MKYYAIKEGKKREYLLPGMNVRSMYQALKVQFISRFQALMMPKIF